MPTPRTIRIGLVRAPDEGARTRRMRLTPRWARLMESDDLERWTPCRRARSGLWIVRKRYVSARCRVGWRLSWVR